MTLDYYTSKYELITVKHSNNKTIIMKQGCMPITIDNQITDIDWHSNGDKIRLYNLEKDDNDRLKGYYVYYANENKLEDFTRMGE